MLVVRQSRLIASLCYFSGILFNSITDSKLSCSYFAVRCINYLKTHQKLSWNGQMVKVIMNQESEVERGS